MTRVVKLVVITLAALLLVLSGAVIWLANDETRVARQIEQHVLRSTGRKLTIGALEIDLGQRAEIHFGEIHLANADWGSAADLFYVDDVRATVSLSRILKGEVFIDSLVLDGVKLNLEETGTGELNWDLGREAQAGANSKRLVRLSVQSLQLRDFELRHESPSRNVSLDFRIKSLTADLSPGGRVDLAADGVIGDLPLTVTGFVDPLSAISNGGEISHQLALRLGEVQLQSEGIIEDLHSGEGVHIAADFSGPDFAWLLDQAALPRFSEGPFDVHFDLDLTSGDLLAFDFSGDLGSVGVNAAGKLDRLMNPSMVELEFDVNGPNLRALSDMLGLAGFPASPFRLGGVTRYEDGALEVSEFSARVGSDNLNISGVVGPPPNLGGTALDIAAQAEDIRSWESALGVSGFKPNSLTVEGHVFEQDGKVAFTNTRVILGQSSLGLAGMLGSVPDMVGTRLEISLEIPDLKNALPGDSQWLPNAPLMLKAAVERDEEGIHVKGGAVHVGDNRLDFSSFLAIEEGVPMHGVSDWPIGYFGSNLSARVFLPDARRFGQLFGWEHLPDQPLAVNLETRLKDQALEFDLTDGDLGAVNVEVHGRLSGLPAIQNARADFKVAIPSLKTLEPLMGGRLLPDLKASVTGSASAESDSVQFEDINGELGSTRFNANGRLGREPEWHARHIEIAAEGPDFRQLLDLPELQGVPTQFRVDAQLTRGEGVDRIQKLVIELGSAVLELEGEVTRMGDLESYDINAIFSAPTLDEFQPFLARYIDLPLPDEALSVSGGLSGDTRSIEVSNMRGTFGETRMSGELQLDTGENRGVSGRIDFEMIDLSWLSEDTLNGEIGFQDRGSEADDTGPVMLLSDEPIRLSGVHDVRLNLGMTAKEVRLPLTSLFDIDLLYFHDGGVIRLDPFDFTGRAGQRLRGSLWLRESGETIEADVEARAENFRFGFGLAEGQDIATAPPWDIDIGLIARGNSVREMASSAIGKLELIIGNGQIANNRVDLIFSDLLSELIEKVNPFVSRNPYTHIECGVMQAEVLGGSVLIDPLIVQTDEIVVTSTGEIALDTEKIDLGFSTRPRTGIGISPGVVINPFIKLGGTLAKPRISLDAPGAAVSSGVAVATSGLSLLARSLFDRYLRGQDPCGKVVEALRAARENSVDTGREMQGADAEMPNQDR